jgi:alkylation response protein AidB-like acyl-CoA dehydrogenase
MVPRGTPGFRVEKVIDKMGHRLCQNNSLVFENVRVPEQNVISGTKGNGDLVISKAFTWSGPVAAIAAVGVATAAYEYTLEWSKGHTAGGAQPIIQHQHVGYLLSDVAMKVEAARYLSWKRRNTSIFTTARAMFQAPGRKSLGVRPASMWSTRACESWA